MPGISKTKKQKGFLQIAFAIVLAISFVLVLYENIHINRQDNTAESESQNSLKSIVRGQSVDRNLTVADYHAIVHDQLIILNKNIILMLEEKPVSESEINVAYQMLITAQVPEIYQKMHLSLVGLASNMIKINTAKPSKERIIEQQDALFKQYPWLTLVRPLEE